MSSEKENWDLVIRPRQKLLDFNLRELWHYRDLLLLFVKRDFTAQYKQTVLGPLWHIIQPIFTTIMFLLVFGHIANIPTDGIEAILFYMSGITIWNYFSTCLTATSSTFITNASIFGKVYFPRLIIPISTVLSNIVKFFIQFSLLLTMMLWYLIFKHVPFNIGWNWLLIPLLVFIMAGIGLGLGIIISSLTTKYRDFNVLLTFGVQLLMYATPIVYPYSFLAGKSYRWVIKANPLTAIVESFRYIIFGKATIDIHLLTYSILFMFIVLFVGLLFFNRVEKTFMDTV
jgi:lipopolysaccharide transport system permease protein